MAHSGAIHDPSQLMIISVVIIGYLGLIGFLAWLAFTRPIRRPIRLVLAFGTVLSGLVPIIYALSSLAG